MAKAKKRTLFCAGCSKDIQARLTDGREVYPHRPDLYARPYWVCDKCLNYVGTHHKTKKPTEPLGIIPTPQLRRARQHIHALLDPLWQQHGVERKWLYKWLSDDLGWKYHTAKIRDIDEARYIWRLVAELHNTVVKNTTLKH